ncbi:MAG: hypothetical protein HY645_03245 [Acidobacteria bacterium]|nr:hypothetical protein [Acidobacteriota bacterium]
MESKGCEYDDAGYPGFFLRELLPRVPAAVRECEVGGILKTDYDFRVVRKDRGEILWYLPNEIGGHHDEAGILLRRIMCVEKSF